MKLKFRNANKLLLNEFNELKTIYNNDYDSNEYSCYAFYAFDFTPYILKQFQKNDEIELKKIFEFVERLISCDDKDLVNLTVGSVIQELYFGLFFDCACDIEKAAPLMLKHCGKHTLKCFFKCFDEDEKAAWESVEAA